MYRPLWIEVDLAALRNNFKVIKSAVGRNVKVMATLKQEAYGHGLLPLARELSPLGVDFFGLGDLDEAITLRKARINKPILILSAVMDKYVSDFIKYRITPTVVDLRFAKELNREAKRQGKIVPVHIKIDTGMGRLGFWHKEAVSFIKKVARFENLYLEGLYTHFPAADSDRKFTRNQIRIFNDLISRVETEGIKFKYLHCANSIAILGYKETHFNLVRPGLILYGIKPIPSDKKIKPILSLKSKVIFIKRVAKGRSISYGRMFIAPCATTIATVAVGYADGYLRSLSNKAKVIINNKLFKVAGRVCMDHIMVDLKNDSAVKRGDSVTLIGSSQNHRISANDLAEWAGTISYEIITGLSLKTPRIYKKKFNAEGRFP